MGNDEAALRAVHSPGRLRDGFASLGRCLSDQSLRGGLAQGSQRTLHDRMLLLAELFGMALTFTPIGVALSAA
jgi:hypothetical protein